MFFTFLLGAGHDADHDLGHDVGHDAEQDVGHDAEQEAGYQIHWFSTKVISAFCSFFGSCGAILMKWGMAPIFTVIFSLIAGGVAGYLMNLLIEFLLAQQCNSTYSAQRLAGLTGKVRTAIFPGSFGEVEVRVKGRKQILRAKCDDQQTQCIQGEVVEITGTSSSSTLTVKKITER